MGDQPAFIKMTLSEARDIMEILDELSSSQYRDVLSQAMLDDIEDCLESLRNNGCY